MPNWRRVVEPENFEAINCTFLRYCQEDTADKSAMENRVKFINIDPNKGSASDHITSKHVGWFLIVRYHPIKVAADSVLTSGLFHMRCVKIFPSQISNEQPCSHVWKTDKRKDKKSIKNIFNICPCMHEGMY